MTILETVNLLRQTQPLLKPKRLPSEAILSAKKKHPEIEHRAFEVFNKSYDGKMCACAIGLCLIDSRGLDWLEDNYSDGNIIEAFREDFGVEPEEVYSVNDNTLGFYRNKGTSDVIRNLQDRGL